MCNSDIRDIVTCNPEARNVMNSGRGGNDLTCNPGTWQVYDVLSRCK